jgi:hypothetical protein
VILLEPVETGFSRERDEDGESTGLSRRNVAIIRWPPAVRHRLSLGHPMSGSLGEGIVHAHGNMGIT